MGELADLERFYEAKRGTILSLPETPGTKVALASIVEEMNRQLLVRWGITTADTEALERLRQDDSRSRMFDPRVLNPGSKEFR